MPKVNRKAAESAKQRGERFSRYLTALVPIGDAIRFALSPEPFDRKRTARAIPEFAARNGLNEKLAASVIYGTRRATEDVCAALARELGGEPDYWQKLLSPTRETAAVSA
jgi:hypothetical protein